MALFSNFFLNPIGLYALASLIPLILLYLIKPKPKKRIIPSLMFFIREEKRNNIDSFFRRFMKDPLFFLQILVLILLSITIAKPFISVSKELFVDNSVIVLDASASMQAVDSTMSRFDKAIDEAKSRLGKRNTIILVTNVPQVLVQDEDDNKAKEALDSLSPRDTTTNLYDAIISAKDFAEGKNSKVSVISDFIGTETESGYITARKALESSGIAVEFVNVAEYKANNIGIIDIDVEDEETKVWVKNFNDQVETFGIQVADLKDTMVLPPGDVDIFVFETPTGINKVDLLLSDAQDDFSPDNEAYISTPLDRTIKVLIFTNNPGKYLSTAFSLIKSVQLDYTAPPKLPSSMNYDVFIFENVDKSRLLPRTMKDIETKVENGSSLIIIASDELFGIDFRGMLPVEPVKYLPEDAQTPIIKPQEFTFTKDIEFGLAQKILFAKPAKDSTVIAVTDSNATMMAMKKYGLGKVFYYGLFDDKSEFKGDIYYPIFWKRLLDFMLETHDISKLNYKTGKIEFFGKDENVKTPLGLRKTSSLLLDKNGVYKLDDKTLVANLASEKESRINKDTKKILNEINELEQVSFTRTKEKELGEYAILLALLFIIFEIFFIKLRGDI